MQKVAGSSPDLDMFFFLPYSRSQQLSQAHANEIKYDSHPK